MSRPIKFRAWDKDRKEFVYISETDEGFWINDGISTTVMPNHTSNLEQYTGLKDKNGKEIYEGDIVKCILGNKPIVSHDCRYWLGETLDDLFVANLRYDIEVIGNIHENPELLGGKE